MPDQPTTTQAVATIRALLAAGWRPDSVHTAGVSDTVRTMLHPSGREISARTNRYDGDTALTLTGLDLGQVAGAITGAGLAPEVEGDDEQQLATDPRRVAYEIVVAGVAAGLPLPVAIDIPSNNPMFELKMPDNDREAVDAWAAHLGLPAARLGSLITGNHRNFRNYSADSWDYPALPGWNVEVCSYIDEPAKAVTR